MSARVIFFKLKLPGPENQKGGKRNLSAVLPASRLVVALPRLPVPQKEAAKQPVVLVDLSNFECLMAANIH